MKVKELVATIGSKKYRLVPAASCKGCAFESGFATSSAAA